MTESAIQVAVRSRPLLPDEVPPPMDTIMFNENEVTIQKKTYQVDHVFLDNATNEEVYRILVSKKIPFIFEGYNVTILAYGPTGSGKTYTIGTNYTGNPNENEADKGIISRGLQEIFCTIESMKQFFDFTVKVSFLELYGEEIYDLLQKSTSCSLRECADGGVKVMNLTEVEVQSVVKALEMLAVGSNARRTSSTAKNTQSSRSHAIFCVYVEQTDKRDLSFKRAKFQLVDLAGSERMSYSKTAGVQIKEGININLGLLALGKVITHIIEEKHHIPFRDSKLTRVLQDSLGGNTHTIMVACINPSCVSVDETQNTVRYASNARKIKNKPEVNTDPPSVQIEKLKKQVLELRAALYQLQGTTNLSSLQSSSTSDINVNTDFENLSSTTNLNIKTDFKLHLSDEKSNKTIATLSQKLLESEQKYNKIIEDFAYLKQENRTAIAELTREVDINPSLQNLLNKFETIHLQWIGLTVGDEAASVNHIPESSQMSECKSIEESCIFSEFIQEDPPIKETVEERAEQQKLCEKLEELSYALKIKTDSKKVCEEYLNTVEYFDEDIVNLLVNKISILTEEKETLQETMKNFEKRYEKENKEKISKYESEIKHLQTQLNGIKTVLQKKEEHKKKVNLLEHEIQELKRIKVKLSKQKKEDNAKLMRMQREKEKEVAKLVKDNRKKEFAFIKMKSKFESQLNVLKKRIEEADAQKKLISARKEKGFGQPGQKKKFKSSSQETGAIEERIDETLRILSSNGVTRVQVEMLVKDIADLNQYLEKDSSLKESEAEVVEVLTTKLHELREDIKKKKADLEDDGNKISELKDSFNSIAEAKTGIEYLIKKCISAIVDNEKMRLSSEEDEKKYLAVKISLEEKVKEMDAEINKTKDIYEAMKHEVEEKAEKIAEEKLGKMAEKMKSHYDSEVLKLMSEIQSANSDELHPDAKLQERIAIQARELEKMQALNEAYEQKCKEVESLQKQIFMAKKGKRIKWLSDLTEYAQSSATTKHHKSSESPEKENKSMMAEFLAASDTDESFSADRNDPDYRATPLYKRRGKLARKISPESTEPETSLIMTSFSNCNCVGECKTLRCRCRKRQVFCSENCQCNIAECANLEKLKQLELPLKRKLSNEL